MHKCATPQMQISVLLPGQKFFSFNLMVLLFLRLNFCSPVTHVSKMHALQIVLLTTSRGFPCPN